MQKPRNRKKGKKAPSGILSVQGEKNARIAFARKLLDKKAQNTFARMLLEIANIGMQKRKDKLPSLAKLAEHREPLVRSRALWSIGAIGDKAGLHAIRRALADPDENVRKTAENAMLSIMRGKKPGKK